MKNDDMKFFSYAVKESYDLGTCKDSWHFEHITGYLRIRIRNRIAAWIFQDMNMVYTDYGTFILENDPVKIFNNLRPFFNEAASHSEYEIIPHDAPTDFLECSPVDFDDVEKRCIVALSYDNTYTFIAYQNYKGRFSYRLCDTEFKTLQEGYTVQPFLMTNIMRVLNELINGWRVATLTHDTNTDKMVANIQEAKEQ